MSKGVKQFSFVIHGDKRDWLYMTSYLFPYSSLIRSLW